MNKTGFNSKMNGEKIIYIVIFAMFVVFIFKRLAVRALAAALHQHAQLCRLCLLPHCIWRGGFVHRVDGHSALGRLIMRK